MDSMFLFFVLLSLPFLCSSAKDLEPKEVTRLTTYKKLEDGFMNAPITTTPITNPVTTPSTGTLPPDTTTPVTAAPTPVTFTPTTPVTSPAVPAANPVTTTPGGQPLTNPVTSPTPIGGSPVTNPPAISNEPAVPGQSWCVARSGIPETALQAALDYACGIGGADCASIQDGANCYNPNSLQNHASYAFNSYYQRNPVQTSCDFGGTAAITSVNPSSGSCVYATWSPSTASPTTVSPITTNPTPTPSPTTVSPITTNPTPTPLTASPTTVSPITTNPTPTPLTTSPTTVSPITTNPTPTPTTESSSGATPASSGIPPPVLNANSPALGGGTAGYGESPIPNTPPVSSSNSLQVFVSCFILVTSVVTGRIFSDM